MSQVKYEFSAMPIQIYNDGIARNLSGNELTIYLFLVMRSRNYQREAYTTNQIVENYTGISRKTVGESLKRLEALGLIWRTQQGIANKSESHYSLLPPDRFNEIEIVQLHRCKRVATTIIESYRLRYENEDDFYPLKLDDVTNSLNLLADEYGLAEVEKMDDSAKLAEAFRSAKSGLEKRMHSDLHFCLVRLYEKYFPKKNESPDIWST